MDREAWSAVIHGVAKSRIQLSDWTDWLTERMVGFPWWLRSKESACNAGDTEDAGLIPGSERFPGGGNGNPLQYSCLGNPMDRRAWRATAQRVANIQFSHSVVSDSLWPHESQHARPPCPSPTTGVHSNSCPSSQWCHPAISSSVVPCSSCPQFLQATESFPMSQLFWWGGQSTGVSALA